MISQAKKEANQRNAKASTGPRTPMGKAIASRNSRRHGLATSIFNNQVWCSQVHRLAKIFGPKGVAPEIDQAIKRLLTAMMEVMRVQAARNDLWRIALVRQSMFEQQIDKAAGNGETGTTAETDIVVSQDLEAAVALEVLPLIMKLERYQRRAEASCRWIVDELGRIDI